MGSQGQHNRDENSAEEEHVPGWLGSRIDAGAAFVAVGACGREVLKRAPAFPTMAVFEARSV